MVREALPIDDAITEILGKLRGAGALVLKAEPGAGKTTRVPPGLLDDGMQGQIVVLQPRRVAARSAAARIAAERGTELGGEVGYQVRHEAKFSKRTRILVCTVGVFLRRLQDDPLLEGIGAVVFDEFHERSVDSDVALALVRQVRAELRDDLRIVVMSATLEPAPICDYLGSCPSVEVPGRTYPVTIEYLKFPANDTISRVTADGVKRLWEEDDRGHVLAFLPGVGEIRQAQELLEKSVSAASLMTLYGEMPLEEQQAVLRPSNERKIVLATNVAETSVTIHGVTAVVDSGFARVNRFQPQLGLNRLETERISRASADQRAGRAGRTGPGKCLRMWTERDHLSLREFDQAEIARVELSEVILQLIEWGEADVSKFGWFEAPPAEAQERALRLLHLLHALDDGALMELGRTLARLPVQPRLGRLLVEGARLGDRRGAAVLAATLSERRGAPKQVVLRVAGELEKAIGKADGAGAPSLQQNALEKAVLAAFPDRVCRRRGAHDVRAVMVGGRGVRLAEECVDQVGTAEFFVAIELTDSGQSESLVRQASPVRREWLDAAHVRSGIEVVYDEPKQKLTATERTRYLDLILDERITALPPGDHSADLARILQERGDAFDRLDDAAKKFFARLQFLREALPELEWPSAIGSEPWKDPDLLLEWCLGCSSLSELKSEMFVACVKARLDRRQLAALDEEAPEKLQLPRGRWAKIEYESGKQPVLAARIQDVFGMKETPRLARGRVPVLMHLLAPNFRVQQITDDLAGFWKNTYVDIKKELKGRYPKHAWPDDPLA